MAIKSDRSPASQLLKAILAKSVIEILLVCAVVTMAAFSNFSPLLRGAIDLADQNRVAGWVHDPLSPEEAIEVQLFIDGRFVASTIADQRRDDLVRAKATTKPDHGFAFEIGGLKLDHGLHSAQVYAVRSAAGSSKALLPISKNPLAFHIAR